MISNHNSPRIVAQKGTFVLFGNKLASMDEVYVSEKQEDGTDKYPKDSLVQLVIPKENISEIHEGLIKIGITDSVAFPDLEGLAREIKRIYKFKI